MGVFPLRVVTCSLLSPRRHRCCLFEQECACPELATLGPQMVQDPVTGSKESYFPHCTCFPHLLTSSAAILVMVRGLWALALAPLFAVLNNWVEIRLDTHKILCEYWRPVAEWALASGRFCLRPWPILWSL